MNENLENLENARSVTKLELRSINYDKKVAFAMFHGIVSIDLKFIHIMCPKIFTAKSKSDLPEIDLNIDKFVNVSHLSDELKAAIEKELNETREFEND